MIVVNLFLGENNNEFALIVDDLVQSNATADKVNILYRIFYNKWTIVDRIHIQKL